MNEAIPTNANPLDTDYSGVDTRRPVLAGNTPYELVIKKCEVQKYGPNTKHPGDEFIHVELANAGTAQSPTGDSINPGQVVIFHNINTKAYGKQDPNGLQKDIARFQKAIGGAGMPLRTAMQAATGKVVTANVKLTPAGTSPSTGKSFPERNEVAYFIVPGER